MLGGEVSEPSIGHLGWHGAGPPQGDVGQAREQLAGVEPKDLARRRRAARGGGGVGVVARGNAAGGGRDVQRLGHAGRYQRALVYRERSEEPQSDSPDHDRSPKGPAVANCHRDERRGDEDEGRELLERRNRVEEAEDADEHGQLPRPHQDRGGEENWKYSLLVPLEYVADDARDLEQLERKLAVVVRLQWIREAREKVEHRDSWHQGEVDGGDRGGDDRESEQPALREPIPGCVFPDPRRRHHADRESLQAAIPRTPEEHLVGGEGHVRDRDRNVHGTARGTDEAVDEHLRLRDRAQDDWNWNQRDPGQRKKDGEAQLAASAPDRPGCGGGDEGERAPEKDVTHGLEVPGAHAGSLLVRSC